MWRASATAAQQPLQFTACLGHFFPVSRPAHPHDIVRRSQIAAQLAKHFAHHAFHRRAGNCPGRDAPADDNSQTRRLAARIIPDQDVKEPTLSSCRERAGEMRPATQPRQARQLGTRLCHTARRARPLARRALMTARPPRLFMRTRKPWVRLRRVFDG